MRKTNAIALAAPVARVVHQSYPLQEQRAQGMPGDDLARGPPAIRKAGGRYHRFSRITRHSLRNGFNGVLRALLGDRAFLPPSRADRSAHLTPASGCRDHTTSPPAFVSRAVASIASRLTFRDDSAYALLPRRDAETILLISGINKAKYFLRKGWTGFSRGRPTGKSVRDTI
jgi:hypothetical protein